MGLWGLDIGVVLSFQGLNSAPKLLRINVFELVAHLQLQLLSHYLSEIGLLIFGISASAQKRRDEVKSVCH